MPFCLVASMPWVAGNARARSFVVKTWFFSPTIEPDSRKAVRHRFSSLVLLRAQHLQSTDFTDLHRMSFYLCLSVPSVDSPPSRLFRALREYEPRKSSHAAKILELRRPSCRSMVPARIIVFPARRDSGFGFVSTFRRFDVLVFRCFSVSAFPRFSVSLSRLLVARRPAPVQLADQLMPHAV